MEIIVAVLAGVAVVGLVALVSFNGLVKRRNRVEAAWADLDVQLTRRADLVPNLVSVVQAYAEHERQVLEATSAARSLARQAVGASPRQVGTVEARAAAEAALGEEIQHVLLLAERYPALKADERFRALADELTATENKIAFSRQLYNDTVDDYRTAAESFPGVLLARPLGFSPPDFFAAAPDERLPGSMGMDRS